MYDYDIAILTPPPPEKKIQVTNLGTLQKWRLIKCYM